MLEQSAFEHAPYQQNVRDGNEVMVNNLLNGNRSITFTPALLNALIMSCEEFQGKQSGYPHLCGVSFPLGKHDSHEIFLQMARSHAHSLQQKQQQQQQQQQDTDVTKKTKKKMMMKSNGCCCDDVRPISAGYSKPKADFIISLVENFNTGRISGEKLAQASDRESIAMLTQLQGIGEWSAAQVLMHHFKRADVLIYGDLTIRNFINDIYDLSHRDETETMLESQAAFEDSAVNRNAIDDLAKRNGWSPYRSVICHLMYFVQEENLFLL